LWCVAGAIAIVLAFFNKTPAWTAALLVGLWVLLLIPALHLKVIREAPAGWNKWLSTAIAIFGTSFFVGTLGLNVWPQPGLGMLGEKDRERFISILKTQQNPIAVHLMCPPNEERECTAATQFISIFGMSNWPVVEQRIDRTLNGTPHRGLYFVLRSSADIDYTKPEFRKPGVGVWTKMQPAYYTAKRAFDELGIKTELVVGARFPDNVLGIHFGVGTAKP
jgi:hypothetical protein